MNANPNPAPVLPGMGTIPGITLSTSTAGMTTTKMAGGRRRRGSRRTRRRQSGGQASTQSVPTMKGGARRRRSRRRQSGGQTSTMPKMAGGQMTTTVMPKMAGGQMTTTVMPKMAGGAKSAVGSKAQVWHGTARHTSGGLTKKDLMKHKGRIISRRKHALGKKALKNLVKAGYKAKKGTFKLFRK